MTHDDRRPTPEDPATDAHMSYSAPEVEYLGSLAELTQFLPPAGKEPGAADGFQVQGIDVGS